MVCWAIVFLWRGSVGNTSRRGEETACFQTLRVCRLTRWENMLKMSNFTRVRTVWFTPGCLTCGRVSDSQHKLVLLGKQHGHEQERDSFCPNRCFFLLQCPNPHSVSCCRKSVNLSCFAQQRECGTVLSPPAKGPMPFSKSLNQYMILACFFSEAFDLHC